MAPGERPSPSLVLPRSLTQPPGCISGIIPLLSPATWLNVTTTGSLSEADLDHRLKCGWKWYPLWALAVPSAEYPSSGAGELFLRNH